MPVFEDPSASFLRWRPFPAASTDIYAGSPSSFITATKNIHPRRLGRSSSSPWMVASVSCIHFGKACRNGRAKLLPSHIGDYVLHMPVVYVYIYRTFLSVTICKLNLRVAIHFTESIMEFHVCANSVYQTLPPIFQAPGNEASITFASLNRLLPMRVARCVNLVNVINSYLPTFHYNYCIGCIYSLEGSKLQLDTWKAVQ